MGLFASVAGVAAGRGEAAVEEAGRGQMVPRQQFLVREGGRGSVVLDTPVAVAVQADIVDVGSGRRIVARQRAEAVLEAEESGLDAVLLGDQIAHPCAGDELLSLEHATEQQADDDQHDGNFDQGKPLDLYMISRSFADCAQGPGLRLVALQEKPKPSSPTAASRLHSWRCRRASSNPHPLPPLSCSLRAALLGAGGAVRVYLENCTAPL